MGANLKPISQQDFSGGENLVVNPYLISQKQAESIENMILDEHGSLRTREGVTDLTTSPATDGAIFLRGNLVKVSGQEFPLAIQEDLSGGGAVSFSATATSNFNATSTTVSATLGGTVTMLIVAIHFGSTSETTVTGITFDSVPMSRIQRKQASSGGIGVAVELWGLVDPTVSSAKNIVASFSGSTSGVLAWHSYINARSWSNTETATGTGTAVTVDVTSSTDSIVVDGVTAGVNTTTFTPGAGQTEMYDTGGTMDDRAAGSRETGAATVTMSHTLSTSRLWVQVATSINSTGAHTLWDTTIEPWEDQGSLNAEPLPDVVYMKDNAILISGYAVPKRWDGTTLTALTADVGQTVPAGAKHGIFHLGALWLWNTAESDTALDGPSSLRASSTNDYDDWPNTNQTFVSNGDGQVGMGMVPFTIVETGIAPTATLVLFKNYRGFQVTGVFGASTFSIQPIKSDMGCIAPRTIQFVSGFGAIRLTHKGFALYNGVEDRLISEEVRPLLFGGPEDDGVDFTTVSGSWGTQSQNPPLYICATPIAGSGLTRLFVYDLIRRGWTHCVLTEPISCMSLIFSRLQEPTIHLGTTTGGKIQTFFDDAETDNGVAIPWSVTTRSFFAVNQMEPTYWRRAQVNIAGAPNSIITIAPIVDGETRTSREYALPDHTGDFIEGVISPDIKETAHVVQLQISGEGHNHIRGVDFHAVGKPITKYRRIGGRTT